MWVSGVTYISERTIKRVKSTKNGNAIVAEVNFIRKIREWNALCKLLLWKKHFSFGLPYSLQCAVRDLDLVSTTHFFNFISLLSRCVCAMRKTCAFRKTNRVETISISTAWLNKYNDWRLDDECRRRQRQRDVCAVAVGGWVVQHGMCSVENIASHVGPFCKTEKFN